MDELKRGDIYYNYYGWWKDYNNIYRYRQGNVPGIRKYKASGFWYRCPQVVFELRHAYIADDDDREVLTSHQITLIEKHRNWLPDPWDDTPAWGLRNKSWKRFRKTQYK